MLAHDIAGRQRMRAIHQPVAHASVTQEIKDQYQITLKLIICWVINLDYQAG